MACLEKIIKLSSDIAEITQNHICELEIELKQNWLVLLFFLSLKGSKQAWSWAILSNNVVVTVPDK